MVSFLMPKSVIGVRRTLLLSREISEKVAKDYPWVAGIAHDTAMAGADSLWATSRSELKKMCTLLAGVAMLTTKGTGDDLIRNSNAFNGKIQLPFIECPPPPDSKALLALVPSTRSWVIYSISDTGSPHVSFSKRGLEGLCTSVLAFRNHFK